MNLGSSVFKDNAAMLVQSVLWESSGFARLVFNIFNLLRAGMENRPGRVMKTHFDNAKGIVLHWSGERLGLSRV